LPKETLESLARTGKFKALLKSSEATASKENLAE
jgi:hypothetical protein